MSRYRRQTVELSITGTGWVEEDILPADNQSHGRLLGYSIRLGSGGGATAGDVYFACNDADMSAGVPSADDKVAEITGVTFTASDTDASDEQMFAVPDVFSKGLKVAVNVTAGAGDSTFYVTPRYEASRP